jgi:hypothetical protein
MPAAAAVTADEPIIFTEEERLASIKRRPVMAQFFEIGKEMGLVRIVDEHKASNNNVNSNSKNR